MWKGLDNIGYNSHYKLLNISSRLKDKSLKKHLGDYITELTGQCNSGRYRKGAGAVRLEKIPGCLILSLSEKKRFQYTDESKGNNEQPRGHRQRERLA